MINLRPYQIDAIEHIKDYFNYENKQYIELPTGSGKTITFLSYLSENYKHLPHAKFMVVVPSKELLNQVYESALLFFDKKDISRKGNGFSEKISKLHICIIHSIRGAYLESISEQYFSLVIIDEAHHVQADSYKRLIEMIDEKCNILKQTYDCLGGITHILGVTATPDRLDGYLISELLGNCSFKLSINQLIDQKYLSDIEGYIVRTNIDLSDVHDHNGDFSIPQLYKKLSTETRNNLILNICKQDMAGRKTIVFCLNIKHSQEIAKSLTTVGISSKAIYGSLPSDEKKAILQAFRNGGISVLCNCQLLTEGFDEPSINGVVLARPTRSRSLFLQMIGRGLRIHSGKTECKIIDIVDNHRSLASFADLVGNERYEHIEKFKGISDIREKVEQLRINTIETKIERVNFFNQNYLDDEEPTPRMINYMMKNDLKNYGTLSFDEASFLIWITELRKKYEHQRNN